ncbi:hypothetical protein GCM10009730_62410 [Streptomyces albidochromogenes]
MEPPGGDRRDWGRARNRRSGVACAGTRVEQAGIRTGPKPAPDAYFEDCIERIGDLANWYF